MVSQKNFQFYLGGHRLNAPSYGFYKPKDVRHSGEKSVPPVAEKPPLLNVRRHNYPLAKEPQAIPGFFKPYTLSKKDNIRIYEDKGPNGVFSCKIGDVVGVTNKDGSLTGTFIVNGFAMDVIPHPIPGHKMQIMAPMAENDGQIFWQAYEKTGNGIIPHRPNRMVWVVEVSKGEFVTINPRKLVGTVSSQGPLNEYESLLKLAFDALSKELANRRKDARRLVKDAWSGVLLDLAKTDHGKNLMRNYQVMEGIRAAMYKVSGFSADNIP